MSFIGVGIQPPTPSLGRMIYENSNISVLRAEPHLLLFPVITVSVAALLFQLLRGCGQRRLQPPHPLNFPPVIVLPGANHRGSVTALGLTEAGTMLFYRDVGAV